MWRAYKRFFRIKSKIYAFKKEDHHESKKAKSINKNAVDHELRYADYKNVLFNGSYKMNSNQGS